MRKLGQRTERRLNQFFQTVGQGCAEHPLPILVPGILVTLALSCGIVFLKVTTDPVELWASNSSRSRIEKDYFDQHFGPFYRNEQIIITAKNLPNITYNTSGVLETYGPILNRDFMYAMLDLQERIINEVVGEEGETLDDICFKPLSPDNTNCSVFSFLEYWQSNRKNMEAFAVNDKNKTFNYLDHFLYCTRNPAAPISGTELKLSCQPNYGGIVDPAVALGGFMKPGETLQDKPYQYANTAILTFVVNNYVDKDMQKAAKNWEKAYIEFMKKYVEFDNPPYMDIAFSSERSIEDELERASRGEVLTVSISYLLMFVYITVALGEKDSWSRIFVSFTCKTVYFQLFLTGCFTFFVCLI